jgi:hypothetical protein
VEHVIVHDTIVVNSFLIFTSVSVWKVMSVSYTYVVDVWASLKIFHVIHYK